MAEPEEGPVKKTLGWIAAGILGVILIAVIWYLNNKGIIGSHTKAIGDDCTFNGDCTSGNCYPRHCDEAGVGDHNLIDGEPCDYNRNCASNDCTNHRCRPKR